VARVIRVGDLSAGSMRGKSSQRPLHQRLTVLALAYAVALASLIASFGAAHAAAALTTDPTGIICHASAGGGHEAPAPSGDETNSKTCIDCCGTGCLMLMAALPPAPADAIFARPSVRRALAPAQNFVVLSGDKHRPHQSRAPPLNA